MSGNAQRWSLDPMVSTLSVGDAASELHLARFHDSAQLLGENQDMGENDVHRSKTDWRDFARQVMASVVGEGVLFVLAALPWAAVGTGLASGEAAVYLWLNRNTAAVWVVALGAALLVGLWVLWRFRTAIVARAYARRHRGRDYITVERRVEADFRPTRTRQRTQSLVRALKDGVDRVELRYASTLSKPRFESHLQAKVLPGDGEPWSTYLVRLPRRLRRSEQFALDYDLVFDESPAARERALSVLVSEPLEKLELRIKIDPHDGYLPRIVNGECLTEVRSVGSGTARLRSTGRLLGQDGTFTWIILQPSLGNIYSIRCELEAPPEWGDMALLAFQ